LARSLTQREVTHLHAHFAHSPAAVAHLAHLAGGPPFSFTAHAKDLFTTPRREIAPRARAASFVVTCAGANREYLEPMVGAVPSDRLQIVYHGTDVSVFNPLVRAPEPGRVVSVGRLVSKKGFADLVESLSLLARRGVRFQCEVFGDGPLRRSLEARIQAASLAGRVTLRGSRLQPEIIEAYHRAAVFALAPVVTEDGDRDGIPNVLVEAMACELPVVSTRVSGIPELIEDGVDGLLVSPGDPVALTDAIQRILNDPFLARSLGVAARRKVERQFDLEANTRTLLRLFDSRLELMGGRRAVSAG
jgi:glycosyltransferase involved in cell wall biosynthesis